MKYNIPQVGIIELDSIILDLNGTVSIKGVVIEGVRNRIAQLRENSFNIYLLSGDQRGGAEKMCKELGIYFHKAISSQEKEDFVRNLNTGRYFSNKYLRCFRLLLDEDSFKATMRK